MRTRWLPLSLCLAASLLAGCGDDDDDPTAGPTTSAPAATTTTAGGATTTAQDPAQDPAKAAKAKAAVLQAGDLGAGYEAQPPDDTLDHDTTFRDLTTCLGVAANGVASATSPTFVKGMATQVTSTVEYFSAPSAQAIATAFAGNPKFATCAKEAFTADVKRNAPEGIGVGTVEVAPLEFANLGQLTSASRITAQLSGPIALTIVQDFIVVFNGEAVSRLSFLNPANPFPAGEQRTLVEKVVGRA